MTTTEAVLTAALGLAAEGYAVLPIWALAGGVCRCPKGAACGKSSGKHPVTMHGVKEASRDEATIRAWWKAWPWAWLAVATGQPSGGRWVLDIDTHAPKTAPGAALGVTGTAALAELQATHGPLPETLLTRTGSGGLHFWFSGPGGKGNRGRVRLDGRPTGIDVRGDGGYVLVPPSGHLSGQSYAWERWSEPVEAPGWLVDWLRQDAPEGPRAARPAVGALVGGSDDARIRAWGRAVLARAVDRILAVDGVAGARHAAIYAQSRTVGGALWALDEAQARAALVDAGVWIYRGQATDGEVGRTVDAGLTLGASQPIEAPPDRPHPADMARAGTAAGMVDRGGAEMLAPDLSTLPADLPPTRWADDDEAPPVDDRQAPGWDRRDEEEEEGQDDGPPPPSLAWEQPRVVYTGRPIDKVVAQAWAILGSYPGATLFRRDGALVTVATTDDGAQRIVEVGADTLLMHLSRAAVWCKAVAPKAGRQTEQIDGVSYCLIPDAPPRLVAQMMAQSVGEHLPILSSVAHAPVYVRGATRRPRLVAERGYNEAGRVWVGGEQHRHREMSAREAVDLLHDWLGEFPFEGTSDFAAAIGFALTCIARRSWRGPALGWLATAPQSRTGKSLLGELLLFVGTGRWPDVSTPSGDPESLRKAIQALARSGAPLFVDNVKGAINSAALEGLLTAAGGYVDRRIFSDDVGRIDTSGLVIAITANGPSVSRDLFGRLAVTRMDAQCPDPGARLIVRSQPIREYTEERQHDLRSALICLLEAGMADPMAWGDGEGEVRRGGFEGCQSVVGKALRAAGLGAHWLHLSEEARAQLVPEDAAWQRLIEWWVRDRRAQRLTAGEMLAAAADLGVQIVGTGEGIGALGRRSGQTWEVDARRWRATIGATGAGLVCLDGAIEGGGQVVSLPAQRRA